MTQREGGPGDFVPAWWLRGAHGQTIGGRLLRRRSGFEFRRERLELPDGDFVDLDWPAVQPAEGTPLVIVLHGLEGSARSNYMLEMYRAVRREGLAAVGLNFRSCSGEPNRLPRLYHSGDTADLSFVLRRLADRWPARRIGAVGFSLGGNVLLKYLGEQGARAAGFPLRAAAAISVPFDLSAGARRLSRGFPRLYQWYLLRKLKRKVRAKRAQLEGVVPVRALLAARTFRVFDDLGTAPLHGFRDAEDYYGRSSATRYLATIAVPTLILHARDDPFLPPSAIPDRILEGHRSITARLTARGGHVGFVAGPPWAPVFWAERTAARFLAGRLR